MDEWRIRREVTIPAAADAVWPYVGRPDLLSRWWCPPPTVAIRFESHAGGRFEEHYRDGERTYNLTGTVRAYLPARRLAVRRETRDRFGPADVIDITLTGDGARTIVAIEHSFERLPAERRTEAQDVYAEAWSRALELLAGLILATDTPTKSTG